MSTGQVRMLPQRSADAAKEIKTLIGDSDVPQRQWVLWLPIPLRVLLAVRPERYTQGLRRVDAGSLSGPRAGVSFRPR